jgi:parallel beta-helix repeat protein
MNKKTWLLLFLSLLFIGATAQITVKRGMTISRSAKVKKGNYLLAGYQDLQQAVIVIEGNDLTVDFNGVLLMGSSNTQSPDGFYGVAVLIKGGKNITIKNLTARGYKVALLARNVEGLKIENCDFSYNYRPRLNSTPEKEDISDWMSYHRNGGDEWLRYGAAIYLKGCNNAIISGNKVTGGQNALLMTECNLATIYNNDFSFNSGIGMGFYRSSHNKVLHNRVNFNVRGYSHGIYNRGQDSAGFLVYEQSSNNLFYKNSATHSGDGFFLWAGQTTMDTGEGGCNDNQILYNDFSYAPTNGVEVTFSRNVVAYNRIFECDDGIWGGYSFQSSFADNQFRNNRIGIAIEHGQRIEITGNTFISNKEAVKLWARPKQPSDWGYAKVRDTRSVDYIIGTNNFTRNGTVFNLQRTDSLYIFDNIYSGNENQMLADSTVTNIDTTPTRLYDTTMVDYSLPNGIDAFKGNGRFAGRKNIRMTEWGPYDFRYPMIWHTNPVDSSTTMQFEMMGAKGDYKIISTKGLKPTSSPKHTFPRAFQFERNTGEKLDVEIVAEYKGPAFTDQFGNRIAANKPYRFRFRKFFQPIDFAVSYYAFDSATNPMKTAYRERIKFQRPFKIESVKKLDYAWWGGIKVDTTQHKQFLLIAEGTVALEKSQYEMSVTWDDAVRVYVDGKLVLDEWNPTQHRFDEAPNKKIRLSLGGTHHLRVEHTELGGFAALGLKLVKL